MRRGGLLVLGSLLAVTSCASTHGHPSAASTTATASQTGSGACSSGQLSMKYGGRASPMTGEHSAYVTVRNVSASSCQLPVYPTVALVNGRRSLPFRFQHGGAYIQDRPGAPVTLSPGAAASFLVAKYRCDVGDLEPVTGIVVRLGPDATPIALPAGYVGPTMDYCKAYRGPASGDPGNIIEIGPYVRGEAHGI